MRNIIQKPTPIHELMILIDISAWSGGVRNGWPSFALHFNKGTISI